MRQPPYRPDVSKVQSIFPSGNPILLLGSFRLIWGRLFFEENINHHQVAHTKQTASFAVANICGFHSFRLLKTKRKNNLFHALSLSFCCSLGAVFYLGYYCFPGSEHNMSHSHGLKTSFEAPCLGIMLYPDPIASTGICTGFLENLV